MQATPPAFDPLRMASALSPALFALGDPDRFVELLSSNPAGVVLVEAGPELTVAYCNEAFRRWVPLGRRPPVGRSLLELFAWSDRPAIRGSYREAIRTGLPLHWRSAPYHERAGTADRFGYCNLSHYPLYGPGGRVTHVLSFIVDVSGQAAARARLRDAQQRMLAGLGSIAGHLGDEGGAAAFFGDLSRALTDLVPAARAAFWLYDGESRTLSPQADAFGFGADELDRLRGLPCTPDGEEVADWIVFADLVVRGHLDELDAAPLSYPSALRALGVA